MPTGDCVVFAIKAWRDLKGPDTIRHTGEHGADVIEEGEEDPETQNWLIMDSTATRAFGLKEGQ